jgi:hypothetical protein
VPFEGRHARALSALARDDDGGDLDDGNSCFLPEEEWSREERERRRLFKHLSDDAAWDYFSEESYARFLHTLNRWLRLLDGEAVGQVEEYYRQSPFLAVCNGAASESAEFSTLPEAVDWVRSHGDRGSFGRTKAVSSTAQASPSGPKATLPGRKSGAARWKNTYATPNPPAPRRARAL